MSDEPLRVTADGGGLAQAPLAIGDVIARYRIDAILGSGGMGVVARARDLDLDRDIALKVVIATSDPARDRQRAERLLHEARTMARLRIPRVRAVHDVGTANGVDYIAMEYIAGVDLERWLATPRPVTAIIGVLVVAGRALAAAHAGGIVHRDVKPANLLIGDDGEVVVSDFGIAYWLHDPAITPVAATPDFAAPELASGSGDARSDQFGFGVTVREAIAGAAMPARMRHAVEAVIRRATAANPDERFPSMAALVNALAAVVRRRRWPIAIGLAACALGAAAAAFAVRGAPEPPQVSVAEAEIDALLAQARGLEDRGLLRSAATVAGEADRLALSRPEPNRTAPARYRLGMIALDRDDTAAARPLLDAAVQLADTRGDDVTRAHALVAQLRIAVTRGSDREAIERAERAARAATERIPPDRELRAWLAYLEAVARGDRDAEAGAALTEARAAITPPTLAELALWAEVTRGLASTRQAAGDPDGAIALLRELVATADRIGGADHMAAISGRGELAMMLARAGRAAEADAMMAELRAAAATPAGEQLLGEQVEHAPVPERTVHVHVRSAAGAPLGHARVVAATAFSSSGTSLLGPDSLYAERARATTVVATAADGTAELRVPRTPMWIAAEDGELGRSAIRRIGDDDHVELVLVAWGQLAGVADRDAKLVVVPADHLEAPRIELAPDAAGAFAVPRIPRGTYAIAACSPHGESETCHAHAVVVGATSASLDLRTLGHPVTEVIVRTRDELVRPIESSLVVLLSGDYAPADLGALEDGWLAAMARTPEGTMAYASVHAAAPAALAVPPGHYTLCAAAIHGDTEDPSFLSRLEARASPIPLSCTPQLVGSSAIDRELVIPAARRVWLGAPPR